MNYPIDKSDLDMFRLVHFLALAVVFVRYIPRDWPALRSNLARPLVLMGQNSLPIFCLGVFLCVRGALVPGSDRRRYSRPDHGQRCRHDDDGGRGLAIEQVQGSPGSLRAAQDGHAGIGVTTALIGVTR